MAGFFGKLKPEDKKKKNPITGMAKVATAIRMLPVAIKVVLGATVVLTITSFFYNIFHWITDYNSSINNPEMLYDMIGADNVNELITIAGNEKDGYYLAFKEGVEERLEEIAKKMSNPNTQTVTKDILLNMIKAELYTQYPNLGGKVGKEANIKLGDATSGYFLGGVMDIPHIYQKRGTSCGPTSVAMVLSYLTGKSVTEDDVYNWCTQPQFGSKYFNGQGSEGALFGAAAKQWGVGSVKQTNSVQDVKTALMRRQTCNCICTY